MENIGVLRQVTRETTNDPVVLFDPTDATRSISRGIAIDYYLKEPADKVVVDILDSAGQVVRSFSGIPAVPDQKPHGQAAESTEAEEEGGGKLAALQGIVESGDGRPTDQAYAVFRELADRLDREIAKIDAVVRDELPAYNGLLAAAKLEPVRDGVPPPTD